MQNLFKILNINEQFDVSRFELDDALCKLMSIAHPDRDRDSLYNASKINAEYQALLDPVFRAKHLLELAGVSMQEHEVASRLSKDFLIDAMSWHVDNGATTDLKKAYEECLTSIATALNKRSYNEAADIYSRLVFLAKFLHKQST